MKWNMLAGTEEAGHTKTHSIGKRIGGQLMAEVLTLIAVGGINAATKEKWNGSKLNVGLRSELAPVAHRHLLEAPFGEIHIFEHHC